MMIYNLIIILFKYKIDRNATNASKYNYSIKNLGIA